MSSKSSSSQAQTTSNQDNRQVTDNGAIAANSGATLTSLNNGSLNISGTRGATTVNVSDSGLLNAGFDYLKAHDAIQADLNSKILAQHDNAAHAMPYDSATGAAAPVANGNLTFTNMQLAIVAGVVAVLFVITKGGKAAI